MSNKIYLIIVAAGEGTRMGGDIPKQYLLLNGIPLLRHTLEAFSEIKGLCHICLVTNPKYEASYLDALKGYSLNGQDHSNVVSICAGGDTRQQSVHRGLEYLKKNTNIEDDEIVLIHDAARPFVASMDVKAILDKMQSSEAASFASKVTDTCRNVNKENQAKDSVSRDGLWALQTPQAFRFSLILRVHEQCEPNKEYTDDTALASEFGYDVALVPTSKYNFKITTQEDIHMAEQLLSTHSSKVTRSGMGYDVHAFDNDISDADTVRLCGVDIENDRALKGHSDADVGLHALCDAIYGAIGEGDIGLHFSPSNSDYKDMDSAKFLEHAMSLLRNKNGELINADVTLICERPKIGEYRDKMVNRIAQIMQLSSSRINVKATTTEKLGFEGRKEGIAAQAIVNVTLPEKQ